MTAGVRVSARALSHHHRPRRETRSAWLLFLFAEHGPWGLKVNPKRRSKRCSANRIFSPCFLLRRISFHPCGRRLSHYGIGGIILRDCLGNMLRLSEIGEGTTVTMRIPLRQRLARNSHGPVRNAHRVPIRQSPDRGSPKAASQAACNGLTSHKFKNL